MAEPRRRRRRRRGHRLPLRCHSGNVGGGCGLQFMPPRLLSGRWRCFFKGRISRTRNCPLTRGQERVMGLGREHRGSNNSQSWAKCLGLCVVSFIPPAHSAGVSVAMRDKAMNVRKVTINHHMAACENAEFMFSKKSSVPTCATVWVKSPAVGWRSSRWAKCTIRRWLEHQCRTGVYHLGIVAYKPGENHQSGFPSCCCLHFVCCCMTFFPVNITNTINDVQQIINTFI